LTVDRARAHANESSGLNVNPQRVAGQCQPNGTEGK
jgi:hypothetical protein